MGVSYSQLKGAQLLRLLVLTAFVCVGKSPVRWPDRDYCVLRCAGAFLSKMCHSGAVYGSKAGQKLVLECFLVCFSPLARGGANSHLWLLDGRRHAARV